MQDSFKFILQIQELDIKMLRLMRVKKERKKELEKIHILGEDFKNQVKQKEDAIVEFKKESRLGETQIKEIQEKVSRLESQQASVKKMDEFNALTKEMTAAGKEKIALENCLSDLMDKIAAEEDLLATLKENQKSSEKSSLSLEKEIHESLEKINKEGQDLLQQKEKIVSQVDPDIFGIYQRLFKNKKDRVVVPMEKRTCSGCHILLTAQHENLVRKGERLVFCEHCSRLLYWQEAEVLKREEVTPRRRRRAVSTI